MSIHSNQKVKSGPSSSRKEIRGANATYKASVQKQNRTQSSTSAAGSGEIKKPTQGVGSAPSGSSTGKPTPSSFGSGHYKPN